MNALPSEDAVAGLAALGLLLTLAVLGLLWWRARRAPQSACGIDLLAVRGLGGRRMVALLGVGNERFLVGLGEGAVSLISKLEPEVMPRDASLHEPRPGDLAHPGGEA